jgi:hypothetical protein
MAAKTHAALLEADGVHVALTPRVSLPCSSYVETVSELGTQESPGVTLVRTWPSASYV